MTSKVRMFKLYSYSVYIRLVPVTSDLKQGYQSFAHAQSTYRTSLLISRNVVMSLNIKNHVANFLIMSLCPDNPVWVAGRWNVVMYAWSRWSVQIPHQTAPTHRTIGSLATLLRCTKLIQIPHRTFFNASHVGSADPTPCPPRSVFGTILGALFQSPWLE
jgi:hypothetical protein